MREDNVLEELPAEICVIEEPAPQFEISQELETPMIEKEINVQFEEFKNQLSQLPDPEAKIQSAINFMEAALQRAKTPDFKSFWEVRRICLELFKESMSPASRAHLWNRYHELSKEAKRIKDILDEQSNFAVEQIGMAIQSLEEEIANISTSLTQKPEISLPENCKPLEKAFHFYDAHQKELNLLNAYASRINSLRKELIKTEMRIRIKNKFFQKLSGAGDHVFPKRKELIQEISQQFISDVNQFIQSHFSQANEKESIFSLRESIKGLQGAAKFLTLNTQAFNQTRMSLSECWDKLKELDKERKKEFADRKELFKVNSDALHLLMTETLQKINENTLSIAQANKEIDDILSKMRAASLGRDEVRFLREELAKLKDAVHLKVQALQEERQKQDEAKDKQRKEAVQAFVGRIQHLIEGANEDSAESLVAKKDELLLEIQASAILKMDKQELEKKLKPIKDILIEKKEQALMSLPEDTRQALEQLKELLKQRKERKQQSKDQLELLRKSKGSSGLDFEKAMQVNEEITLEKERFELANIAVKEIENKIKELEI